MDAYLGVTRSATGRAWAGLDPAQERLADAIAQSGQPHALARHLARRGVAAEEADAFLDPKLRDWLPDPASLRDMEAAAERLARAATAGERIAIFADYDVDGAASAALLVWWLRGLGRDATVYVPDRLSEGYGPNAPAIAGLAAAHDLILCVDCGTAAPEALAAADGTDVIVLDHHLAPDALPEVAALVNPNRGDEDGALAHLCAAAVVFLCLAQAGRALKARGVAAPDLMAMTDLVALATVADVAPLTGVNRALVRTGLKVMARRARPGLVALADVAGLDGPPTSQSLGYLLGPRINAGGRIGASDLGARLLCAADAAEAQALARRLHDLNAERRRIEARVTREALEAAAAREGAVAWAMGADWHPGVVGIVASRLKEATGRPAIVLGLREDGTAQGSGRSVPGVDLGAAVHRLVAEGLAVTGGGHPMAAGLTLRAEAAEAAMDRLAALVARAGPAPGRALALDATLMPRAATVDLVAALEGAGPFGQAAAAPRFAFPGLRVRHHRTVGDGHIKLDLTDGAARLDGIAFGAEGSGIADAVRAAAGAPLHVAGRLEINRWQGRARVQIRVDDVAAAGG